MPTLWAVTICFQHCMSTIGTRFHNKLLLATNRNQQRLRGPAVLNTYNNLDIFYLLISIFLNSSEIHFTTKCYIVYKGDVKLL